MRRTDTAQGRGERWVWMAIHGVGAALAAGGLLVGLMWGLGISLGVDNDPYPYQVPKSAADPGYDQLPDGGVLLGEELCAVLDGGCSDAEVGQAAHEGER
ncbi:MAG: hypothetical protein CMH57_02790 [Myxococcales bacterium]|nr:hypothetical protein [Myxococcales bacterium]